MSARCAIMALESGNQLQREISQLNSIDVYTLLARLGPQIVDGFMKDVPNLATEFLAKGFISADRYQEIIEILVFTERNKARMLFSSLLTQIRQNHEKLSVLMEILHKNVLLHDDLIKAIHKEVKEERSIKQGLNPLPESCKVISKSEKIASASLISNPVLSTAGVRNPKVVLKEEKTPKIHSQTKADRPAATQNCSNLFFHQASDFRKSKFSGKLFVNRREKPLPDPCVRADIMKSALTRTNYKRQFEGLLYHENRAHIKMLQERLDDEYTILFCEVNNRKPAWIRERLDKSEYARYGYIKMTGDQVAYAVQSTRRIGAVILESKWGTITCLANILQENYSHTADHLYIGFNTVNANKLSALHVSTNKCEIRTNVTFELKHSYFHNLNELVCQFSDDKRMLDKIIPEEASFSLPVLSDDLNTYKDLCSIDQFAALQAIASCPPNGPPVVITGPFGTGKTWLLAVAARYFLERSIQKPKGKATVTRILVCTQQRVSASNFLSMYLNLNLKREDSKHVHFIQSYGQVPYFVKKYSKNVQDFVESTREYHQMVAITTCLTARSLARFLPSGFFTHILIDEGAQMREPEAIAPLLLADPNNTKIVIAGDDQQIGPGLLVFGETPSSSTLSVSLLERLHQHYKCIGVTTQPYIKTLTTNFRSRSEILELTGKLFYETEIVASGNKDPHSHKKYKYPLVFVCSSVNDSIKEVVANTNKSEAMIVINNLADIVKNWTDKLWGKYDRSSLCVMSPSRAQLTVIKECIEERKMSRLDRVGYCPTFAVQGREYRALVLSTAEPIHSDGSTKNPLKSLTNRFIFNTAITRAQSLVIAVGNPFQLLKMEEHMIKKYGEKGKCWSNYFSMCLKNDAFAFDDSLNLLPAQKKEYRLILENHIQKILSLESQPKKTAYKKTKKPNTTTEKHNSGSIINKGFFDPTTKSSLHPVHEFKLSLHPAVPGSNFHPAVPESSLHPAAPESSLHPAVPETSLHPAAPETSLHPAVPETSLHPAAPETSLHPAAPETSLHPAVPETSLHPAAPETSLHPAAPETSLHPAVPETSLHPAAPETSLHPAAPESSLHPVHELSVSELSLHLAVPESNLYPAAAESSLHPAVPESSLHPVPKLSLHPALHESSFCPVHELNQNPTDSRFKLNEMHKKKLISKPDFDYNTTLDGKYTSKVTFTEIKTSNAFVVESDIPASSRAKSRENAASKALDQLKKAGIVLDLEITPDQEQHIPTKKPSKPKLAAAVLKEMCDKCKLKYDFIKIKEITRLKQSEFQATVKVTNKINSQSFEVTGDTETSKKNAKHAAAAKAIHHLRNRFPFQTTKPKSAEQLVCIQKVPKKEATLKLTSPTTMMTPSSPRHRLEEDYKHIEEIAFGGFGVVHLVESYTDRQRYALKMIPIVEGDSRMPMKEAQVLAQITHNNILRYYHSRVEKAPDDWKTKNLWKTLEKVESLYQYSASSAAPSQSIASLSPSVVFDHTKSSNVNYPPTCLCIFTEFCEEGTLGGWLERNQQRIKKEVINIFDQVLCALYYLHGDNSSKKKYVHRDLKPSNVFFKDGIVKIGDFGLVKDWSGEAHTASSVGGSWSQSLSYYASRGGTPLYLSPEQLEGKHSDEKVDMYALGLILFELLYPMTTGSEKIEKFQKLKDGEFPKYFEEIYPYQSMSIINHLLQKDPKSRMSANRLKSSKEYELFKENMRAGEDGSTV